MQYRFDDKRHLHTLDGVPLTGTSSIINVLSKPLSWWAAGKAVERLGWSNPKTHTQEERLEIARPKFDYFVLLGHMRGNDGLEGYLDKLDIAYKAHATSLKESAVKGTDLHAELEDYVKGWMGIMEPRETWSEKVCPFIDWAEENVTNFLWSEAHCFDQDLFVGGISDAGALMKDGTIALIDFKSSREAYASQFIQCAGYQIQIEKNGLWDEGGRVNKKLEGKIGKLIVVPFGAEVVTPEVRINVEDYKQGFRSAVQLYRLMGLEQK